MIDPDDYWVNNPLITPVNKALMYDNAIFMAKADKQDDIIDLLKESSRCRLDGGHDNNGFCFCEAIALIKGEQK